MVLDYTSKLTCVLGAGGGGRGENRDEKQSFKQYYCSAEMSSLTTRPQALCINNECTSQGAEVIVLPA